MDDSMLVLVHVEDERLCSSNETELLLRSPTRSDIVCKEHGRHFYLVQFSDGWVHDNVKDVGTRIE